MRGDIEKLESGDKACAPRSAKVARKRVLNPFLADTATTTLEEIDDSAERTNRNLHRLMDEVTKYSSPQGTPDKRKSVVSGAGMTNAQIAEHYSNCLKLSAENKINLKNAFDLHLIDYMSSMLSHSEANFQTASSTIDAGAKIYAYRVDSLYKETYKIYGGLGRGDKGMPVEDGEMDDPIDDAPINKPPPSPVHKKKKKKITRGSCIETNEKALNHICNEAKFQTDELFESVRSCFEEGDTSGLFLNTLSTLSDNGRLILHSFCDISSAVNDNQNGENFLELFKESLIRENPSTCDAVAQFDFCNWSLKKDNDDSYTALSPFNISSESQSNDKFAAKDVEPTLLAANGTFADLGLDDRDTTILNESIEFDEEKVMTAELKPDSVAPNNVRFKALEAALSTKDLEYSYFDPNLLQTWMGPNHWKLKRMATANSVKIEKSGESQDPLDGTTTSENKSKAKQKGKRKQAIVERINFNEKIDFKKVLKTTSKSSTVLSDVALSRHKACDLVFEPDVDRQNSYNFNSLMLKPEAVISKKHDSMNESYVDAAVTDFNLEREADMQDYCPGVANCHSADDNDISFGEVPDENDYSTVATAVDNQIPSTADADTTDLNCTIGDTNMVEQPYKVNKIDINYAKHAKRIDVKKLKTALWRILSHDQPQNESISKIKPQKMPPFQPEVFSKLCQQLPKHVSGQMMQNLTTHTIFTVLLHMCNEKNLELEGETDFSDFGVKQG